jgi:outer membrane protein OmpU
MDKLKKVGLTALGTALVSSASVAGDMAVTGSAIMTFVGNNNENTNNGWSMSDTMSFSGSGDLDNGWSVTFSHAIDNGSNDANSIAIDMGDMGSLTFAGKGGSGPVAANDDKMPSANEESWANSAGTKTSAATGASGNSGFNYTLPELMENVSMEVYYLPSAAGSTSSFEYGLTYTGIEGLTVGYAGGDNETTATNTIESTNLWATYVYDSFTIGAQRNETDQQTTNADSDFAAYGVSYAVNDELSVSYGISTVEHENSSKEDQDASAVSFSYVTGGMTISGSMADVDNVGGTASVDNSGYELNVTFAF